MAVVPQQGWYIVGEETGLGDYWVISNSGDTTGYYFDASSGAGVAINGWSYGHLFKYWQGWSDFPWFVDNDWIIKASVSSKNGNIKLLVADKNNFLRVAISPEELGNGELDSDGFFYFETSVSSYGHEANTNDVSWYLAPSLDVGVNYCSLQNIAWSGAGHTQYYNGININDLIICVVSSVSSSGGSSGVSAHLAITFLCPKNKAPAGMQIGDQWPKVRDINVSVDFQEIVSEWEERQLDYSDELLPYGKTTAQLGALGSSNQLIVNDVTDNTIGQFGVTNDQINNIADMLTGSFYLHVLTISGLFIVLLFFIKKGMA